MYVNMVIDTLTSDVSFCEYLFLELVVSTRSRSSREGRRRLFRQLSVSLLLSSINLNVDLFFYLISSPLPNSTLPSQ